MFIGFLTQLKQERVPVTIREWLTLAALLDARIGFSASEDEPNGDGWLSIDDFYYLARLSLVKNEIHFDRFDRAFAHYFKGLDAISSDDWKKVLDKVIPKEWLEQGLTRHFSREELEKMDRLGFDNLMKQLAERMQEQTEAHHGGSKWIGTGGTSPFGHSGQHPEGIRVGGSSRNRSAVKVWEARTFRNLDDQVEIGNRNIKMALRRLRQFARDGAEEELDLHSTISQTARNAGYLSVHMQRVRHNSMKVLLLMDIGGSMDDHVRICEKMFSACKSEFKQLEYYYFHNCIYDFVWRDNARRHQERISVWDLMHKYGSDYRLIIVGDAAMSPYEITHINGSVESLNKESGETWLRRVLDHFEYVVWINPEPEKYWTQIASTKLIRGILGERMFALTLAGINSAVKSLRKK